MLLLKICLHNINYSTNNKKEENYKCTDIL